MKEPILLSEILPDISEKLPGRGIWVKTEKNALDQAISKNLFLKAANKKVLVLDPMLATGNSSIAAINLIKNKGVNIKDVFLVSLLAAPEGIKNLEKTHRSLHIFTCQIDAKLNKKKFIVPGLGDAGDRYMGT